MIKIKKYLRILAPLLTFINKLIIKKRRIVLYSNLGFRDNVEALYNFIIKNHYNYKYEIICSCNDYKDFQDTNCFNVQFTNIYFGLYYFLTSKYFFYSFGKYPIYPSKDQVVVNLWHGMPLKRIGALVCNEKDNTQDYFTFILATSDFFSKILQKAFKCSEDRVLINGQPRNDYLFEHVNLKEIFNLSREKIICYMPTYRMSRVLNSNNSTTNDSLYSRMKNVSFLKKIDNILNRLNVVLFIKFHPMEDLCNVLVEKFSNIKFINEESLKQNHLNTYKVLGNVDALITDYSSVYFDFILLNRPIAFIVDDIYDYNDKRGFVVEDPFSIMPGKIIENESDLFRFFDIISKGEDVHNKDRQKLKNVFNTDYSTHNCKDLFDKLGI